MIHKTLDVIIIKKYRRIKVYFFINGRYFEMVKLYFFKIDFRNNNGNKNFTSKFKLNRV